MQLAHGIYTADQGEQLHCEVWPRDMRQGFCTLVLSGSAFPRRACAARVTVVVLRVCVCVCLSPLILTLQAPNRFMSDTNGSSATNARKIMWRFR